MIVCFMERKYLCFWALAVMLLCGIQQVKADDNQPRFMIPTADITDGGIGGVAAICEKNPYFTIYLWTRNVDHKDSYWESEPTLTVDGHSVKLTGLKGNHGFGDGIGNFVCYDSNKVYYYVRSRGGFMAGDNKTFTNIFPDLKKKSNWDQDYYIPLDIIMYENHNTAEGETHKVSVRGKAKLDKTTKDIDVKDLNDKTELTNQKTVCPFIYSAANSSLEWTAPDTLSFTSCDFSTQNWGRYRVALDDQVSDRLL